MPASEDTRVPCDICQAHHSSYYDCVSAAVESLQRLAAKRAARLETRTFPAPTMKLLYVYQGGEEGGTLYAQESPPIGPYSVYSFFGQAYDDPYIRCGSCGHLSAHSAGCPEPAKIQKYAEEVIRKAKAAGGTNDQA